MPKKQKLSWKDHQELLEFLMDHNVKQASLKFKISEGALRGRLFNIRKSLSETQGAINRIRTLQRISPRVRKLTTTGGVPSLEEGENFENN